MLNILLIGGNGYNLTSVDTLWHDDINNIKNKNYKHIKEDYRKLEKSFINCFDVIILLAAHSSVGMCKGLFSHSYKNNVENFVGLLDKINRNQKFIYASSSSVYGFVDFPVAEDHAKAEALQNYDASKLIADIIVSRYDIEYYALRFGTVNGFSPYTREDIMLNSMVKSAIQNKKVNIFNPEIMRPILGISDLVKAIDVIIKNQNDLRGIYNLASFNANVLELGKTVCEITESELINNGISESTTYNFMISSEKFYTKYNFSFKCTAENIVKELLSNQKNLEWTSRKNSILYY